MVLPICSRGRIDGWFSVSSSALQKEKSVMGPTTYGKTLEIESVLTNVHPLSMRDVALETAIIGKAQPTK